MVVFFTAITEKSLLVNTNPFLLIYCFKNIHYALLYRPWRTGSNSYISRFGTNDCPSDYHYRVHRTEFVGKYLKTDLGIDHTVYPVWLVGVYSGGKAQRIEAIRTDTPTKLAPIAAAGEA